MGFTIKSAYDGVEHTTLTPTASSALEHVDALQKSGHVDVRVFDASGAAVVHGELLGLAANEKVRN